MGRNNACGYDTESRYIASTSARAQGVVRRNLRLELMLGSCRKHRIGTRKPISSHPYLATRCSSMVLRVIPCRGLLGCALLIGAR